MVAPGLLARPPEEGARRLALAFLDQAAAAWPRLRDPSTAAATPADTEALHDFRVGLRRLRSCLRAYRQPLAGCVPKKLARRLRRLARATGPGRDAEVQVEWLASRRKDLGRGQRAGLAWEVGRLGERLRDAYGELVSHLGSEFPGLESDLRQHISVYRAEIHLEADGAHPTLGSVTAAILREQIADLAGRLSAIHSAGDEKEAHQARISAKRLRYLVEPFGGEPAELPGAAPLVKRLKGLQDLLGELHDAHVLAAELAAAVETAAAERARRLLDLTLAATPDEALLRAARRRTREPGLLALARDNRERRDHLFHQLESHWLGGQADGFLAEVEALAETMEGTPAGG